MSNSLTVALTFPLLDHLDVRFCLLTIRFEGPATVKRRSRKGRTRIGTKNKKLIVKTDLDGCIHVNPVDFHSLRLRFNFVRRNDKLPGFREVPIDI